MKSMSGYRILAILVTATIFFAACTKENAEVKLDPNLSTAQVLNLTSDSVTVVGFVIASGDGFTEKGVCYNTSAGPTTANTKVVYSGQSTTATFNVKLKGLTRLTKYYARAYAINSTGTIYGEEIVFTTTAALPALSNIDGSVLAVTADKGVTATTVINITDDGGPDATADITGRGVVYSLFTHPTLDSTKSKLETRSIATSEGTGKGQFTSLATNLRGKIKYYLRAYATNKIGTTYSNEISFTTPIAYPIVKTTAVTGVTGEGASSGGEITDDGGDAITARGVCWSTGADPTIAGSKTSDGTGKGVFTSEITGLSVATTYHVRAYATNSVGVAYGPDVQFSTFPPALFLVGDGVSDWTWNIDLPMVPVNGKPNLFWKIVWMNATGGIKINAAKAWDGSEFGKTGNATDGVYAKGGDNIPVPGTAGYYMLVVDLAENKIAIADPKVYLIGDAMGSWDVGNAAGLFTVDNANGIVTITKTLLAANIRMYAWHPWFTDWWRSEFNIFSGKIVFRGNGGDQAAVPVTAGSHKIDLNFKTGDGAIN